MLAVPFSVPVTATSVLPRVSVKRGRNRRSQSLAFPGMDRGLVCQGCRGSICRGLSVQQGLSELAEVGQLLAAARHLSFFPQHDL